MIDESETGCSVHIIILWHSSVAGVRLCCAFYTGLSELCKNVGWKWFHCSKPACFDFSSSNFNFQSHILGMTWLSGWSFVMHFGFCSFGLDLGVLSLGSFFSLLLSALFNMEFARASSLSFICWKIHNCLNKIITSIFFFKCFSFSYPYKILGHLSKDGPF